MVKDYSSVPDSEIQREISEAEEELLSLANRRQALTSHIDKLRRIRISRSALADAQEALRRDEQLVRTVAIYDED